MPISLANCLLKDFMYQQDASMHYVFSEDKLVPVDRDQVADTILKNIDEALEEYLGENVYRSIDCAYDPFALNQALCRYSRDVFGEKRLHARVMHFEEKYKITNDNVQELIAYEDYGIKINSCSPYLHRRIANLFYWFSTLKPFKLTINYTMPEHENLFVFFEYQNEFTTYILAHMVLELLDWTINIHENYPLFKQFLYDLHFRKLSRSSLEFFLSHHIVPKS